MPPPIDILLVDDEARNLDALESILGDPGYRLLRAEDSDLALRLLLEHEVAAIVLDIKMPGVSGFELARIIKDTKRFRQTPIVFLTAYMVEDQDVVAGYGAGAVDYLTKPVNPQILRQKIAVFAELHRKTRALAELNEKLEDRVRERTAELERSEAALRTSGQQKDEFLAVLAHELRNPLAPLRTGLDLLVRQQPASPVVSRTLGAMNRQLDHMVRLIDDLLDISRITRGLLELKRAPADLRAIVQSTLDGCRPLFENRRQTLSLVAPEPLFADADLTRVGQIVGNLLHNATKFTPVGGQVRVELAREQGNAVVRVIDSGVGIRPDQLDRVFEMFVRIDGAGENRGLGIGLALARRLAEMHGGTLTAASPGEGKGTTVILTLPSLQPGVGTAPHTNGAPAPSRATTPLRILIIEDNDDVADTLASWLEDVGHRVSVARSGPEGVERVQQDGPQVVLCDLGLPGMDGLDVCRSVRGLAIAAQPTMVALTGWGREDDRRRTSEAGFDHHLVKPVSPDRLEALLQDLGG
jgi:signal transduction histidine kinase